MSVQENGKCVLRSIEVMTIVTPQRNFDVCTTDLLDMADQLVRGKGSPKLVATTGISEEGI